MDDAHGGERALRVKHRFVVRDVLWRCLGLEAWKGISTPLLAVATESMDKVCSLQEQKLLQLMPNEEIGTSVLQPEANEFDQQPKGT